MRGDRRYRLARSGGHRLRSVPLTPTAKIMSQAGTTSAASPGSIQGRHASANVARLAVAQALAGANSTVVYATGAIVGNTLAPDKALATLPISIFVVGMAACTLPAGAIAQRHGRRAAFLAGTGCGVLVGLLSAFAVVLGSFWLFCLGTFFGGAYAAVVLSFRFAAADSVPAAQRPRALSLVMAGGVFAGVIGPQLVTHTMDLWLPHLFAATFVAQAGVAALCGLILAGVRLPMPTAAEIAGGRPLFVIARQPRFIVAVICGVVSYLLMNFLMTAAPLAMRLCGLSQESANLGLQWHVIAMYAPSFFTGRLIARFGKDRIVIAGLALLSLCAVVSITGISLAHFWGALILLGVGWNFGFMGATAMLTETYLPQEKGKVQGLNDFLVFATSAASSFGAGVLFNGPGWGFINAIIFPVAILCLAALAWTALLRSRRMA